MFACIATVFIPTAPKWAPYVVTAVLCMNSVAMCWIDVIVDGLVVKEQRKDPVHGSSDLQVFSYVCLAFGGVVPNALAIVAAKLTLQTAYIVPAVIGLMILVASMGLSVESNAEDQAFMDLPIK